MFDSLKGLLGNLSRRDLLTKAGLLAAAQAASLTITRASAAPLEIGSEIRSRRNAGEHAVPHAF